VTLWAVNPLLCTGVLQLRPQGALAPPPSPHRPGMTGNRQTRNFADSFMRRTRGRGWVHFLGVNIGFITSKMKADRVLSPLSLSLSLSRVCVCSCLSRPGSVQTHILTSLGLTNTTRLLPGRVVWDVCKRCINVFVCVCVCVCALVLGFIPTSPATDIDNDFFFFFIVPRLNHFPSLLNTDFRVHRLKKAVLVWGGGGALCCLSISFRWIPPKIANKTLNVWAACSFLFFFQIIKFKQEKWNTKVPPEVKRSTNKWPTMQQPTRN